MFIVLTHVKQLYFLIFFTNDKVMSFYVKYMKHNPSVQCQNCCQPIYYSIKKWLQQF